MFKSQFFKNGTFTQKSRKKLKEDYTSVNILQTLSNIFERIMFAQISAFFGNASPNYHCEFRKDYSTQQRHLKISEKWEKMCRQRKSFQCFINRPLKVI